MKQCQEVSPIHRSEGFTVKCFCNVGRLCLRSCSNICLGLVKHFPSDLLHYPLQSSITFSHFTRDPHLHSIKLKQDSNLHDPRFTPLQIYKTQYLHKPRCTVSINTKPKFTRNPILQHLTIQGIMSHLCMQVGINTVRKIVAHGSIVLR